MIGDVVFFKKENSIISKTKSEYTHVGIVVAYDELTDIATIIESNRFIDTSVTILKLDEEKHRVYTIDKTKEQEELIVKYSYELVGFEYDYMQIFGMFLSIVFGFNKDKIFNNANKLICSELIDNVYLKSGIKRNNNINIGNVTPQDLLEVYDFKLRKEA